MKNVLLTTTALVAFAGMAAAEVSLSGSMDTGYYADSDTDFDDGEFFMDGTLDFTASVDLGDGYAATMTYGIELDGQAWGNVDSEDHFPTIEITAPFGSLKFGDLDDEGASEYFYADRDGMHVDVENHDAEFDTPAIRGLAEFGDFGVAVGCDFSGAWDDQCDGINFGAGGTFGDITFGLGFDGDEDQDGVTAFSVDSSFGGVDIGVSYASNEDDETSIGLALSYAINDSTTIGGFYANNDDPDDAGDHAANDEVYGVSISYDMAPITVAVAYEAEADGDYTLLNLDATFAVNGATTLFVGYQAEDDDFDSGTDSGFYAGVEYAVNDSITLAASYNEEFEMGDPEYDDGVKLWASLSF